MAGYDDSSPATLVPALSLSRYSVVNNYRALTAALKRIDDERETVLLMIAANRMLCKHEGRGAAHTPCPHCGAEA